MPLEEITPTSKPRLMDLVKEAGIDVRPWGNYKRGPEQAAANPRYCYEWSFVSDESIVVTLWLSGMSVNENGIMYSVNQRRLFEAPGPLNPQKHRARHMDYALQLAFQQERQLRVVVCDGDPEGPNGRRGRVKLRMLDPKPWAVDDYIQETGDAVLVRGAEPVSTSATYQDRELSALEGVEQQLFVTHRRREWRLRDEKIRRAMAANNGRLVCEVPECGFDFFTKYGEIGEGYAQVHHIEPLNQAPSGGVNVSLDKLAIVCANCHVMIHRNGKCRDIETLISDPHASKNETAVECD